MNRGLHVLVLPSWYPSPEAPNRGVFFKEQAQALKRSGVMAGVAYPELRRLRTLNRGDWARNWFQTTVREEYGLPTVRLHGWNVPHTRLRGRMFARLGQRLVEIYEEEVGTPDLIHAHGALWAGVAARRVWEQSRLPYVLTEHSSEFLRGTLVRWQSEQVRQACEGARQVVAVSRALARAVGSHLESDPPRVIPNMVRPNQFILPPEPRRVPPFVILSIAMLRPNKRIDLLLRAFARAFPDDPHARVVIGGDGPSRSELEELAMDLGIAHRTEFLGRLSREEVLRALWKANVFVLSSQVETFGVVLLEAMATGLPVVATACGGPEDIVNDEVGWLVESGNVTQLMEALREVRAQEPRLRQRASRIRRVTLKRFGEPQVVAAIKRMYRSVLSEREFNTV